MDPVSHLLVGGTIAVSVRHRPGFAGVTTAVVLSSIAPDVDVIWAPWRFDLYLRLHASGTHSLLGAVIVAGIFTVLWRQFVVGSRPGTIFVASCAGVAGHIFCDLADGSDIRVFAPFSDRMYGWHLVAMAEPIILVTLAGAVLLAWRWRSHARIFSAAAFMAFGALLVVKVTTQGWAAKRFFESGVSRAGQAIEMSPRSGSLFGWTIFERTDEGVYAWNVDGRTGPVSLVFEYRDPGDEPTVTSSRQLPVVRTFLQLSKIPFARIERDGPRRLVLWSDASRCSSLGCDLSFGGAFDASADPLYQVIRIGGFNQERALPPARDSGSRP